MAGASNLGTLLTQRIETALGVTLSSRAVLMPGKATRTVTEPGAPASLGQTDNPTADASRNPVDRTREFAALYGRASQSLMAQGEKSYPRSNAALSAKMQKSGAMDSACGATTRPTPMPASTAAGSSILDLSAGAKLLLSLVHQAQDNPSGPVQFKTPLFAHSQELPNGQASSDIKSLALTLKSWLVQSGLFYESQLLKLILGKVKASELRNSPQNIETDHQALEPGRASKRTDQSVLDSTGAPKGHDSVILGQQIQALNTSTLAFTGLLAPCIPFYWHIFVDDRLMQEESCDSLPAETLPWVTQIELTLPNIGDVLARLSLREDYIDVQLSLENEQALPPEAKSQLERKLSDLGLRVQGIRIGGRA